MSLLAILFSLAIEYYYNAVEQFRNYDWVTSFSNWIKERFSESEFWNDTLGLIATILIPMFVCALVYGVLDHAMGLLGFLFSLLVLIYCQNTSCIPQASLLMPVNTKMNIAYRHTLMNCWTKNLLKLIVKRITKSAPN